MDHGPINTWDRVPYLTKVLDPNHASLLPMENFVSKCLIIGNYNSQWPIDHDDGSSYWADSYNFVTYGGFKNYLGHSFKTLESVYVYPDKYASDHFCMDTRAQQLGAGKIVVFLFASHLECRLIIIYRLDRNIEPKCHSK